MKLNYWNVDAFVAKQQALGNKVVWNGWKMIFFTPHKSGFYRGVHRDGEYGFETVVEVDHKGFWNVPPRVIM